MVCLCSYGLPMASILVWSSARRRRSCSSPWRGRRSPEAAPGAQLRPGAPRHASRRAPGEGAAWPRTTRQRRRRRRQRQELRRLRGPGQAPATSPGGGGGGGRGRRGQRGWDWNSRRADPTSLADSCPQAASATTRRRRGRQTGRGRDRLTCVGNQTRNTSESRAWILKCGKH